MATAYPVNGVDCNKSTPCVWCHKGRVVLAEVWMGACCTEQIWVLCVRVWILCLKYSVSYRFWSKELQHVLCVFALALFDLVPQSVWLAVSSPAVWFMNSSAPLFALVCNPCATFCTFCLVLIILPVLMLSAYILAQVCIFISILIFPLINLFYIRYKKIIPLSAFWTKMSPLKPIKTAIFKHSAVYCNIMQFLLIGFYSVGKTSKLLFFTI